MSGQAQREAVKRWMEYWYGTGEGAGLHEGQIPVEPSPTHRERGEIPYPESREALDGPGEGASVPAPGPGPVTLDEQR